MSRPPRALMAGGVISVLPEAPRELGVRDGGTGKLRRTALTLRESPASSGAIDIVRQRRAAPCCRKTGGSVRMRKSSRVLVVASCPLAANVIQQGLAVGVPRTLQARRETAQRIARQMFCHVMAGDRAARRLLRTGVSDRCQSSAMAESVMGTSKARLIIYP